MMKSTSSKKLMLKTRNGELDGDVVFVIFIVEFIVIGVDTGIELQTRSLVLVPGVETYSLALHEVQFVHALPVNPFEDWYCPMAHV